MQAPYFVEILTRAGQVRQRISVPHLPIGIGRAYDNEVILDDPHAAPHHAVLELDTDGQLQMRDLGSKNGMVISGKRVASARLDGDTVLRLGHNWLRVRSADYVVPNERLDTTAHGWEGWPPAIAAISLIILFTSLSLWLDQAQKAEFAEYLMRIFVISGMALVWSTGWALASRITSGQAHFGRHLLIAVLGWVCMMLGQFLLGVLGFAFSLESLFLYGNQWFVLIGVGMLWQHLITINPLPRRRFTLICTGLAVLGSGLLLTGNYVSHSRLADQPYMSTLLPPALHWSGEIGTGDFVAESAKLKLKLEEDKKKQPEGDGEE